MNRSGVDKALGRFFRLYPLRTADKLLTNLCKNKKQTPQVTYLRSLMELVTGLEPATCSLRKKIQRAKQRIYYSLWGVNCHKSNAVADKLLTGHIFSSLTVSYSSPTD